MEQSSFMYLLNAVILTSIETESTMARLSTFTEVILLDLLASRGNARPPMVLSSTLSPKSSTDDDAVPVGPRRVSAGMQPALPSSLSRRSPPQSLSE